MKSTKVCRRYAPETNCYKVYSSKDVLFQKLGHNRGQRSWPPKGTSTTPKGYMCEVWMKSIKGFRRYALEMNCYKVYSSKDVLFQKLGHNRGQRSWPPKGTSTTPKGYMCEVWMKSIKGFRRYAPEMNCYKVYSCKDILTQKLVYKKGQRSWLPKGTYIYILLILHYWRVVTISYIQLMYIAH